MGISVLTFACAFGLVEIGHRTWRRVSGWPYDAEKTRLQCEQALSRATQSIPMPSGVASHGDTSGEREVLHPYAGFGTSSTNAQIEAELTRLERRTERTFPILVLGGSVAQIFADVGHDAFVDALRKDPRLRDRDIDVMNHARGGYKQPQQLNELQFLLSIGIHPAAVVEIDGFNEVALGNDNATSGMHPLYPSRSHWLHLIGPGPVDRETIDLVRAFYSARDRAATLASSSIRGQLWRSSVLGTLALRGLRSALAASTDAQVAYVRKIAPLSDERGAAGPPIHGGADEALAIAIEGWAQSSISMRAMCAARRIPYVHVLQPTLHDDGSKPLTDDERAQSSAMPTWVEGARIGYPRLRARGARLRDEGVRFVDASFLFADVHETLYYDLCHFGARGNELLAQVVASALLEGLSASER